jgi:hypothetical protein
VERTENRKREEEMERQRKESKEKMERQRKESEEKMEKLLGRLLGKAVN